MSDTGRSGRQRSAYLGWYASAIFLAVTFAAAAAVWFIFHPW